MVMASFVPCKCVTDNLTNGIYITKSLLLIARQSELDCKEVLEEEGGPENRHGNPQQGESHEQVV